MRTECYQIYGTFRKRKVLLAERIKSREDAIEAVRFMGKDNRNKYEIHHVVTEDEVLYSITGKQAENLK